MKVCYFGTYRAEYSRNRSMIEGLRSAGVDVIECHEELWTSIEDRVTTVAGGWKYPQFWMRLVQVYWNLTKKYLSIKDHDIVVIGYPGQLDVLLARILCWFRHKPLVWDIFMSIYLISIERKLRNKNKLSVGLLRILEWISCRIPDFLILDTKEYVEWFVNNYHIGEERFKLVPTGANDLIFHPIPSTDQENNFFTILYFGTFIPNHKVEVIINAANLLKEHGKIRFELIGTGPDLDHCHNLVNILGLTNIVFIDWMPENELVYSLSSCDVCLGAFGTTPQSLMTIQNKIYIGLAMAKPVITGVSPAIQHVFTHGEEIFLCKRDDPNSLAEAILFLYQNDDLRTRIANQGYQTFKNQFSVSSIGSKFSNHLQEFLEKT